MLPEEGEVSDIDLVSCSEAAPLLALWHPGDFQGGGVHHCGTEVLGHPGQGVQLEKEQGARSKEQGAKSKERAETAQGVREKSREKA